IPTGKLFDSCTSKVDSEPLHGSNVDIPHIHECKQTLDVSADPTFRAGNPVKEFSESTDHSIVCYTIKWELRIRHVLQPHSSEVEFINHMLILKPSKSIIHVKIVDS
ncbi:hypothetical protein Tco_0691242, partial [Tanacetum coccineum]